MWDEMQHLGRIRFEYCAKKSFIGEILTVEFIESHYSRRISARGDASDGTKSFQHLARSGIRMTGSG